MYILLATQIFRQRVLFSDCGWKRAYFKVKGLRIKAISWDLSKKEGNYVSGELILCALYSSEYAAIANDQSRHFFFHEIIKCQYNATHIVRILGQVTAFRNGAHVCKIIFVIRHCITGLYDRNGRISRNVRQLSIIIAHTGVVITVCTKSITNVRCLLSIQIRTISICTAVGDHVATGSWIWFLILRCILKRGIRD